MPTSLVTGGAGFLGSHIAEYLLKSGHSVVVLDDLSGGFADNIPAGAVFIRGSIVDRELLSNVFSRHAFDFVYHLAAYAAEGLSHFIKCFNYTNNLLGSVALINEAVKHNIQCFVFTSSIAVYGSAQSPMTEDMTPVAEDSYGIAKYAVEQELAISHKLFGLEYVIFRPHNIYGPKQNIGDRYRNVAGIFMNQLLKAEPMTIFGDGTQMRAFTYVDDVAPIIARSVTVPSARNQVFNVGADIPYTVNQLAELVARAMGKECNVRHLDSRKEVKIAFSSHKKAEAVFGSSQQISLEEGISRMAEWVQEHGARESSRFEEIEIWKNLPSSWAIQWVGDLPVDPVSPEQMPEGGMPHLSGDDQARYRLADQADAQ
jgi:UDP-glucose 4-epimerase